MTRLTLFVSMLSLALALPASAQNCTPDSIVLGSQADVDDFQADHGPCDHVVGILEVSGPDIVQLTGLSGLTSIGANLVPADRRARGRGAGLRRPRPARGRLPGLRLRRRHPRRRGGAGRGGRWRPCLYPTPEPVFNKRIKAAYDGQTRLGIAVFEIAQSHRSGSSRQPMELVFDPSGAARVVEVTPDEEEQRSHFWMNEHHPTFLVADPPAERGEACFEVELNVDGNKRLLITARDLRSGKLTHQDFPVVKLT